MIEQIRQMLTSIDECGMMFIIFGSMACVIVFAMWLVVRNAMR